MRHPYVSLLKSFVLHIKIINKMINIYYKFLSTDYLLSNNHVNSIIVHKFDFSDEEVMAYYISFLKTLSLKLNAHTIHFFYNEVNKVHMIVFCVYVLVVLVDFLPHLLGIYFNI